MRLVRQIACPKAEAMGDPTWLFRSDVSRPSKAHLRERCNPPANPPTSPPQANRAGERAAVARGRAFPRAARCCYLRVTHKRCANQPRLARLVMLAGSRRRR